MKSFETFSIAHIVSMDNLLENNRFIHYPLEALLNFLYKARRIGRYYSNDGSPEAFCTRTLRGRI
jgi:hypothetical protein